MLKDGAAQRAKREPWVRSGVSRSDPWSRSQRSNQTESETELDGYVAVPNFRQSFSDAIAVALEKAEHAQGERQSLRISFIAFPNSSRYLTCNKSFLDLFLFRL